MRKLILVLSAWLVLLTIVHGQMEMNFSSLDKQTYDLYLKKNWKELISLGKKGIDNGFDYFYLRMRIGIAYYEQGKYRQAIPHFRKALGFNSKDHYTNEYLYYSYLFSGRKEDAINLSDKFTAKLKKKLEIKKVTGLRSFSIYNTYSFNTDRDKLDEIEIPEGLTTLGWQNIKLDYNLFQVNFEHMVSPKLSVSHGYGYLKKQRYHLIQTDSINQVYPDETYKQFQAYFSGNLLIANGLTTGLTFHYLNLRPLIYLEITGGFGGGSRTYIRTDVSHNFAGYFSVNKKFGLFNLSLGLAVANLNDNIQFQKDLFLTFFPLGNLNFYLSAKGTHHSDFLNLDNPVNKWIFEQKVGFKIFSTAWIELYGSFGDKSDFIDHNGTVIYNEFNPIVGDMGFNLIFSPQKTGTQFYLNYRNQVIESSFNYYIDNTINAINEIDFNTQTITGGIKWNF